MNLTYKVPKTPTKPFAKGDVVEVCDRDGNVLSEQKIVRVTPISVKTKCGRWWTRDGWWRGSDRDYPFPSIRHRAAADPATKERQRIARDQPIGVPEAAFKVARDACKGRTTTVVKSTKGNP